jgi:hypothetical protein
MGHRSIRSAAIARRDRTGARALSVSDPGVPEIPENPMFNMKPNSLIYGARYDRMI